MYLYRIEHVNFVGKMFLRSLISGSVQHRSYDRESKPVGNHPDCVCDLRLWAGFILRIQLSESHDGGYCLCDGILPTACVVRGYLLLVFERMRAVPGQAEYIPRLGFSLQDALTLRAAYPSPALPPPFHA